MIQLERQAKASRGVVHGSNIYEKNGGPENKVLLISAKGTKCVHRWGF